MWKCSSYCETLDNRGTFLDTQQHCIIVVAFSLKYHELNEHLFGIIQALCTAEEQRKIWHNVVRYAKALLLYRLKIKLERLS